MPCTMEVWRWCPYVAETFGSITRSNIPPIPGREVAERGPVELDEGVDCGDSGISARLPDCDLSNEDWREWATARRAGWSRFRARIVSSSQPSLLSGLFRLLLVLLLGLLWLMSLLLSLVLVLLVELLLPL